MKKILLLILFYLPGIFSNAQRSIGYTYDYYYANAWQDWTSDAMYDGNGYFYLYGQLQDPNTFGYCYFVIKTDTMGNLQWAKDYGLNSFTTYFQNAGQGNSIGSINYDTYSSTPGVLVAGAEWGLQPNITKIGPAGNVLWSMTLSATQGGWGVTWGSAMAIKSTPGGNYYVVGTMNENWNFNVYGSGPYQVGSGEYVPWNEGNYGPQYDVLLAKINPSGTDTIWKTNIGLAYSYAGGTWDSTRSDYAQDFMYDKASNGIYISGYTIDNFSNPGGAPCNDFNKWQHFIMKTDTNGNVQWCHTFYFGTGVYSTTQCAGGQEFGGSIVKVADGSGDYISVCDYGNDAGILAIRIHNTGVVVWAKQYSFGASSGATGAKIANATDGNVLISSAVYNATTMAAKGNGYTDFFLMEVNPATAAVVNSMQTGSWGLDGTNQSNWWGPRPMQVGIGTYAVIGEADFDFNSSYSSVMVTKFPRQNFATGASPCITNSPPVTITDVTPGISNALQERTPAIRVGSAGAGYSLSGATSMTLLTPGTNIIGTDYSNSMSILQQCIYGLPIQLVNFTGTLVQGIVRLDWSTESEINNHFFTIERSTDGINWQSIGTVAGAGNSDVTRYYTTYDNNPVVGVDYYRLSQTDYDGHSKTFDPIAVNVSSSQSIRVYPTLATDVINVQGDVTRIIILNELGQEMIEQNITDNKTSISLGGYSMGVYVAELFDKQGNMTVSRFMKQ